MTASKKLDRRRWLAGIAPAVADTAVQAIRLSPGAAGRPRRRPPGALDEAEFLERCTRCDACIDVCEHRAVFKLTEKAGFAAGTPVMRPDLRACQMCQGFPCATACPEGALSPPEAAVVWLGTVRLREDRCIAYQGPECGACVGLCPEGLRAVVQVAWRPRIEPEECIGCGKCISACPTDPKAIELVPLRSSRRPG